MRRPHPTALPRRGDLPVGVLGAERLRERLGTSVCDPATGYFSTTLWPRTARHEGEPCELIEGAHWRRTIDLDGEPSDWVICTLEDGPVDRIGLPRADGDQRCATGGVVDVGFSLDRCITDPDDLRPIPAEAPAVPDANGCTPITCASAGLTCGIMLDGCGGYVDCHSCSVLRTWPVPGLVSAVDVSRSRQEVYTVSYSPEADIHDTTLSALAVPDLTVLRTLEVPADVREMIVDDEQGRIYLRFLGSPTVAIVDIEAWTVGTFDLPEPPEPPDVGPSTFEISELSLVPGRPDRLAVYVQLPAFRGTDAAGVPVDRPALPAGLWLLDPADGRVVARQDEDPAIPLARSVFPGPEGVVYAGLEEPLFLRRFDVSADRVEIVSDSPNRSAWASTARWRSPVYVDGRVIDASGLVLDEAGEEVDRLGGVWPGGFVIDAGRGRVYGAVADAVRSFDTESLRELARAPFAGQRWSPENVYGVVLAVVPVRAFWLGGQRLLVGSVVDDVDLIDELGERQFLYLEMVESDAIVR